MTDRGLKRGTPGNWSNYPAVVRTFTAAGGSTQPTPNDATTAARFTEIPGGIIVAQVQLVITTAGTGDAYGLRLPRPMDQQAAPYVSGTGIAYKPFATLQENMPVVPRPFTRGSFADLPPGEEDYWIGFQYPYYLEKGTATITSGAFLDVSHSCPWTPTASEVNVTPTGLATTNTQNFPWSVTPTSSDFRVSMRTGTGVDVTFSWKMCAYPAGGVDAYLGPKKPWVWGILDVLFVQFYYAAR